MKSGVCYSLITFCWCQFRSSIRRLLPINIFRSVFGKITTVMKIYSRYEQCQGHSRYAACSETGLGKFLCKDFRSFIDINMAHVVENIPYEYRCHLFHTVNAVAVNGFRTQWARASTVMVLHLVLCNISVSALSLGLIGGVPWLM